MLSLNDLSKKIQAYRQDTLSLRDFEEWFEDVSTAAAYDDPELRGACAAVDAAFSEYHFDAIGEELMKRELAAAIRPFDEPRVYAAVLKIVYRKPPVEALSATQYGERLASVSA